MSEKENKVLIIDDDQMIRSTISDFLKLENYTPLQAADGETGLEILRENPDTSAIILDWMLPSMDGLQVLKRIKEQDQFSELPVIMQTGKKDKDSIIQGINCGAYYYLTKPYNFTVLLTILKRAVTDYERMKAALSVSREQMSCICRLLAKGEISLRTTNEAILASSFFAHLADREKVQIGMKELLLNAIEHGILGIGYDKKEEYLMDDILDQVIEEQLQLNEHKEKSVSVSFEITADSLKISIRDPGKGFDYKPFTTLNHDRIYDLHGRGIIIAFMIFGERIKYKGKGNEIEIVIPVN